MSPRVLLFPGFPRLTNRQRGSRQGGAVWGPHRIRDLLPKEHKAGLRLADGSLSETHPPPPPQHRGRSRERAGREPLANVSTAGALPSIQGPVTKYREPWG